MKITVWAFALATAVVWGFGVLFVGLANLKWPWYGVTFLNLVSSVYPGYHGQPTLAGVLVGTGYAVVDGLATGAVLAWVYNMFAKCCGGKKAGEKG